MSRHTANVVCFVIVLMTSRHVTGQENDVTQLNKRLTFIKSYVDRDISDIRFQIFELKMTVEQMVVDQRNASAGSIIGGPFPDYGQGITGGNQKEITHLKNKLEEHENRLNRLFSTVYEIQDVNSAHKRTAKTDIGTNCDDRLNALQKKFEETASAMMKGFQELKTHVNVKVSLFDHKLSARIDETDAKIARLDGEVNKLEVNKLVENTERNELIKNVKAELLQLNAGVETKCDARVNALQKRFDETAAINLAGYKDLETQMSVQMKNLTQSVSSEQNKLSARMDQADAKVVRLDGGLNTLDGVSRTIEKLKTRIEQCCIDCGDPTPGHGTVNTTATTYGTVAQISCNHGYVLSGTSIIKCNADSAWSESATCNLYDCGPAAPANGVATAPKGTTYRQQATVQCNPTYTLNGSSVIECNATGWNESVFCVDDRQQPMSATGYRVKPIFGRDLENHIKVGTRVVRGRDWIHGDQDGGGPGTVTRVSSVIKFGFVWVKWDKGQAMNYRYGLPGKYDLLILED